MNDNAMHPSRSLIKLKSGSGLQLQYTWATVRNRYSRIEKKWIKPIVSSIVLCELLKHLRKLPNFIHLSYFLAWIWRQF